MVCLAYITEIMRANAALGRSTRCLPSIPRGGGGEVAGLGRPGTARASIQRLGCADHASSPSGEVACEALTSVRFKGTYGWESLGSDTQTQAPPRYPGPPPNMPMGDSYRLHHPRRTSPHGVGSIACFQPRGWKHRLLPATVLEASLASSNGVGSIACFQQRGWKHRLLPATREEWRPGWFSRRGRPGRLHHPKRPPSPLG